MEKNVHVRKSNETQRVPAFTTPLDRLLDTFFGGEGQSMWPAFTRSRLPSSNIQETDDCYYMTAEVPGISEKEVEINVSGNVLSIHAEHKEEEKNKEGYRRNFSSFHQSYTLPNTVDADKIEAHCENGFLEVLIPKTASSKAKTIEVQSGKGGFFNRLTHSEKKKAPEQKH